MQRNDEPATNDNPIKTLDVKRANKERDETVKKSAESLSKSRKLLYFTRQSLSCLEIASCSGTMLKSSFFIEVQIESSQLFSNKINSIRFPIKFLKQEGGNVQQSLENRKTYSQRNDFPKMFDPLVMAGSHFYNAYN